jgi:hypothetical protein
MPSSAAARVLQRQTRMSGIREQWHVEPHGELLELDDNLLTVQGEIVMPLGRFPRRMTVVGLAGGGTAIWSPIALREPEMRRIEALGEPKWLIVPGVAHRLDVRVWKSRYPQAQLICAPGAKEKVEEAAPVAATSLDDERVRFEVVAGTQEREAALLVYGTRGDVSLVVNDIIANVRHPHGLGANVMARIFGFGVNQPAIPRVGKWFFINDTPALAATLRRWADTPNLRRLIPSHGEIIDAPQLTLHRLAGELDAHHAAA